MHWVGNICCMHLMMLPDRNLKHTNIGFGEGMNALTLYALHFCHDPNTAQHTWEYLEPK